VAFADPCGRSLELPELSDVADLRLGADRSGELLEPLGVPGEEDAAPPACDEEPRGRRTDAGGPAGYDRDANVRRVSRLISTVSPIGSA
jgi:hypothetical protein